MGNINNPWIKLKEHLNEEDCKEIEDLQQICTINDKSNLKLELDYKLMSSFGECIPITNINEFMYYNGQNLIGYLGICSFGKSDLEVNGMVHPNYRRQGVFSKLFQLVKEESRKRENNKMLLLCDRESKAGQEFINSTGFTYEYSEYEMYLNMNFTNAASENVINDIVFRKAKNSDSKEIAQQNAIYFGSDLDEVDEIIPEEEEKRGMIIYLVVIDDKVIGKVHLIIEKNLGGIYGLGVKPEYRSRGYGRKILLKAIDKLKESNVEKIMLQVEIQNENALILYKSCGFEQTSTMDYFCEK